MLPTTRTATVVVFDANAALLELIEQALRESGHRVLVTMDPLEAIAIVRRVRVDVIVAGDPLAGRRQTLLEELRSMQPGMRIVSICDPDDESREIDCTLSWPFSLDDLREAVAGNPAHRPVT